MQSLKSCWEREGKGKRSKDKRNTDSSILICPTPHHSVFQQAAGYGGPVAYCLGTACERLSPRRLLAFGGSSPQSWEPPQGAPSAAERRRDLVELRIPSSHSTPTCQLRSRKMALFQTKFESPRVFTSILRKLGSIFLRSSEDEMRSCI